MISSASEERLLRRRDLRGALADDHVVGSRGAARHADVLAADGRSSGRGDVAVRRAGRSAPLVFARPSRPAAPSRRASAAPTADRGAGACEAAVGRRPARPCAVLGRGRRARRASSWRVRSFVTMAKTPRATTTYIAATTAGRPSATRIEAGAESRRGPAHASSSR